MAWRWNQTNRRYENDNGDVIEDRRRGEAANLSITGVPKSTGSIT